MPVFLKRQCDRNLEVGGGGVALSLCTMHRSSTSHQIREENRYLFFKAAVRPDPQVGAAEREASVSRNAEASVGFGRIAALCHRSSTLHRIC